MGLLYFVPPLQETTAVTINEREKEEEKGTAETEEPAKCTERVLKRWKKTDRGERRVQHLSVAHLLNGMTLASAASE